VFAMLATDSAAGEPPITAAAFAPGRDQVLLGSQAGVQIRSWPDLPEGQETIETLLTHVHDLQFSPDGAWLLVAGGSPAEAGGVEILDWSNRRVVHRLATHEDLVYRVHWSPDGTRWVTASADGTCDVHSLETGERVSRYAGHSRTVLSVRFLDLDRVASVSADQTVRIWDARTGAHLRTLDQHAGTVNDLIMVPDADVARRLQCLTISEDRTVRLWQPLAGRLVRFARLDSVPRAMTVSRDGKRLFVACNDGAIRAMDSASLQVTSTLTGAMGRIHELLLDQSGRRLLCAGSAGCFALTTAE
jgi:WD40 repeat protein